MPATDTGKKVESVLKRRQSDGKWVCAVPYGYIADKARKFEIVPTEADIVWKAFALFNHGWGYKKTANYLTDEGMHGGAGAQSGGWRRVQAAGEGRMGQRGGKDILDSDCYIGTLRQGKYLQEDQRRGTEAGRVGASGI